MDFTHVEHNEAAQKVIRDAQSRADGFNQTKEDGDDEDDHAPAWQNPEEDFDFM